MKTSKLMRIALLTVSLVLAFAFSASAATWSVPGDFATIQEAIGALGVTDGDTIMVGPGSHAGALVTKMVEIKGRGGATINDGPVHGSGLLQGFRMMEDSDGATISHLRFEGVDLAIMNGAGVHDVTGTQNTFISTIQAISNWMGSRWEISHNVITDLRTRNGGGIGILVADFSRGVVEDNVVSHNKISGTLYVDPIDGGEYNGSGIVLYADFRWGRLGAKEMTGNRVVKNKVGMVSDTPGLVDIVAFEMTEARDDEGLPPVIFGNSIGFNDFRGTAFQIALTPESLDDVNNISRNLGDNRGHGLHPKAFGPGGQP